MLKKSAVLVVVLSVVLLLFTGCSSREEKLRGIWEFKSSFSGTIRFMLLKDNTHFYKIQKLDATAFTEKKGPWKLDGDKLTLTFDDGGSHEFVITEMDDDKRMTVRDMAAGEGGLKGFQKVDKF